MTNVKKFSLGILCTLAVILSALLFIPSNTISSVSAFEYKGVIYSDKVWVTKTWYGNQVSFNGYQIWTDGTNIYHSLGASQMVLDISTSYWSTKTWIGLTSFNGEYIWTDGTNIYFSQNTNQYVLDTSTSTWTAKTWYGLTSFSGINIWSDGTNFYYSASSTQYVLDTSTSTWTVKTWNNLSSFAGRDIWTDGTNFYYSSSYLQYILDSSTSTWSVKTWYGYSSLIGRHIWTDGSDVYYSDSNSQFILDKSTSTWSQIRFTLLNNFSGRDVWTDGTNIFHASGSMFIDFEDLLNGGYDEGYTAGYTAGETAGYSSGYSAGETAGYSSGYTAGETAGYSSGYDTGYSAGYDTGLEESYDVGYNAGYNSGYTVGYDAGYENYSELGYFPYDNFNLPDGVYLSDVAYYQLWHDDTYYYLGNRYRFDPNSNMWTYYSFNIPYSATYENYYYYYYDGYYTYALSSGISDDYYLDTSTNSWVSFNTSVHPTFYYSYTDPSNRFVLDRYTFEYNDLLYIYSNSNFYVWNRFSRDFDVLTITNQNTILGTIWNFVIMEDPSSSSDNLSLYICSRYTYSNTTSSSHEFLVYLVDLSAQSYTCVLVDDYKFTTSDMIHSLITTNSGIWTDGNDLYFSFSDLNGVLSYSNYLYLPDSTDSNIKHELVIFPLLQGPVLINYLRNYNNVLFLFTTPNYTNLNSNNHIIFRYDNTLLYSFHLYDIDMYDTGYNIGYVAGVDYSKRIIDKNSASYNAGYQSGIDNAGNYTFNSLLGSVIDVPVHTFTSLLNFNILGVNILDFLLGLMTLAFVVFVVKMVLGGR